LHIKTIDENVFSKITRKKTNSKNEEA